MSDRTTFGGTLTRNGPARRGRRRLPILVAGTLIACAGLALAAPTRAEEPLTDAQKAAVESLIERYIAENPEKILKSVENLRNRQKAEAAERAKARLVDLKDKILNDPESPVAGNPNGDVTVVEFFDYRCGYCKASLKMVMNVLRNDPNVRFVFKEFPILSPESNRAAKAALAARKQDKYLAFHAAMMGSRGTFSDDQIMQIAGEVGLDTDQLARDMKSPEVQAQIDANHDLARQLDIGGTPAFIVDDQIFRGAIDEAALKKAISERRAS